MNEFWYCEKCEVEIDGYFEKRDFMDLHDRCGYPLVYIQLEEDTDSN